MIVRDSKARDDRPAMQAIDHPSGLMQSARRARLLAWLQVDLVVDVGANAGQYGQTLRDAGYRGPVVSFEPLTGAFEELSAKAAADQDWSCRNVGLGRRTEVRAVNVAMDPVCSSFLPAASGADELDPGTRCIGQETVEVRRLDDLWPEFADGSDRAYLKADVQGYELAVVEGAASILGSIQAIELELSLVRLYRGAPLADALIARLADRGFFLAAVECIHDEPNTGQMLQLDAVFVRRQT
jgi:FkbM family methyltransferase